MKDHKISRLLMGCLSSRSTVAPTSSERVEVLAADRSTSGHKTTSEPIERSNGRISNGAEHDPDSPRGSDRQSTRERKLQNKDQSLLRSSIEAADEDIMSMLMKDSTDEPEAQSEHKLDETSGGLMKSSQKDADNEAADSEMEARSSPVSRNDLETEPSDDTGDRDSVMSGNEDNSPTVGNDSNNQEDDALDLNLLHEYVVVECEIKELEDRDALRIYHEKIDRLELLENELDLISSEADEVASRNETKSSVGNPAEFKADAENNSMYSGTTGSISRGSWLGGQNKQMAASITTRNFNSSNRINGTSTGNSMQSSKMTNRSVTNDTNKTSLSTAGKRANISPFATVEEVFERKIILERERDKLKKEVELVIAECDKLQRHYKKRDTILDKLFEGRKGNGLENHLEQQLAWLMEQKHYVDQVFYAWKRAETLTGQACEDFTNALDILKQIPDVESPDQRSEMLREVGDLLVKSRDNMDQAQKYNPNVDAPFFTDNETARFQAIIESIKSNSIGDKDYNQVVTVIRFAHKRVLSIRLWLEQVLQTTIARDSFELAEEYKWIAIQLRKERINLIKTKLETPPYDTMVLEVQQQMAKRRREQQDQALATDSSTGITSSGSASRQTKTGNGDSGVDSETNDFEGEIYRLLELNRSRLEAKQLEGAAGQDETTKASAALGPASLRPSMASDEQRNQRIRDRVQKRARGEQPFHMSQLPPLGEVATAGGDNRSQILSAKPKIEFDEESKQRLLQHVKQVHSQHRSRLERVRGNNRAKMASSLINRMQLARASRGDKQGMGPNEPHDE